MRRLAPWLLAGLLVYVALAPGSACSPYAAAWRTTAAVRNAGTLAANALATAALAKHDACTKSAAGDKAKYRACAGEHYRAAKAFRTYAVPAINTAVTVAVTSILLAERSKKQGLDWLAILKPATCALAKAVQEFRHLIPADVRRQLDTYLALVKGVACG